jgi:GalNAc-alpha-(1->4)-GalNAc-alpha-(1->3)-diNAcBac-PP-undecaprenol alpha-1,4-N-acetyl-D-galactosaminyltransferase
MVLDPIQESHSSSQTGNSLLPKGRLTFVIHRISAGGAERVLTLLANELCEQGWSVTLLTFDSGCEPVFFALHSHIQHSPLSLMREQGNCWKAIKVHFLRPWVLRRAIRRSRPDAVISFIDLMNILTLVATIGLKIPVIISERAHPVYTQIWKFWSLLRERVYNRSACLVVQTSDVKSFFSSLTQKKIRVIPNPVLVPCLDTILEPKNNCKTLLAMGRLCEQKGFDLLLNAFAPLCKKSPDWLLEIWGEGEQRANLERLRDDLCLQQWVSFPGLVKEPYNIMSRADIFVLSSRFEGFPNVLGEAMACGLPVVSFDCPSGPSEMIRDGVNGLLVPSGNIQEMSSSLERLMTSVELRKSLGEQAKKITETYSLDKIINIWEELIVEVVRESKI